MVLEVNRDLEESVFLVVDQYKAVAFFGTEQDAFEDVDVVVERFFAET